MESGAPTIQVGTATTNSQNLFSPTPFIGFMSLLSHYSTISIHKCLQMKTSLGTISRYCYLLTFKPVNICHDFKLSLQKSLTWFGGFFCIIFLDTMSCRKTTFGVVVYRSLWHGGWRL